MSMKLREGMRVKFKSLEWMKKNCTYTNSGGYCYKEEYIPMNRTMSKQCGKIRIIHSIDLLDNYFGIIGDVFTYDIWMIENSIISDLIELIK